MIFKRVNIDGKITTIGLIDGQWLRITISDSIKRFTERHNLNTNIDSNILVIADLACEQLSELKTILLTDNAICGEFNTNLPPLQPISFRDFMLFEKHVIDSTRGYVKRFLPKLYPITAAFEKITGKTFKKFKPHKLWYQQPIYYFGNHLNMGTSGEDIVAPKYTNALDYELEIGAILSRPLLNASPEEAIEAIGGYVILNDLSARDMQRDEMESGFGPQKAKHFYSTMSCEFLTARDMHQNELSFTGSVVINGKVVAHCNNSNMKYTFAQAISYASRCEQLHAGELFGSGTLPGGSGMETGNWIKSGDLLTLKIEQIGELTNNIV